MFQSLKFELSDLKSFLRFDLLTWSGVSCLWCVGGAFGVRLWSVGGAFLLMQTARAGYVIWRALRP